MSLTRNNMALGLLLAFAVAGRAAGQGTGDACRDGRISYIFIDNHSIFDTTDPDLDPRFRWAYRLANKLHRRTRDAVVRRELLFDQGDCYDPFLLTETERILRGYPFLSRVDVFGIRQESGDYHVVVDTQDDWSTQLDLGLDFQTGVKVEVLDFREQNLAGTGQTLGFFYEERDAQRNYGLTFITPQLLHTRWDLVARLGRTRAGTLLNETITYPFLGDVGHRAFRQSYLREDRFFAYSLGLDSGQRQHVLVPVRDERFSMAAVTRLGSRNNLTLLGGGVAMENLSYPGGAAAITQVTGGQFDQRVPADSALVDRVDDLLGTLRRFRVVALLGQRNLRWVQRRAMDSFRGQEDVRLGVELQLGVGRAVPILDGANDWSGTANLFMSREMGPVILAARGRMDGRRTTGASGGELEDILGIGDLFGYLLPRGDAQHTFVLRTSMAGGWHMSTPFQLTLGGELGVRGYHPDAFPGGRRLLASLEDRIYFGWPWPDVMDFGTTLFVDAGRVWPGEAPFGVDSGWRASVGAGLRFNFPAGGRTTYRIDLALPVERGVSLSDLRLVVNVGELLGLSTPLGDPQVARSRRAALSGDLFHFPR